jgi:DNA-binding Xre family transcriptional regulator
MRTSKSNDLPAHRPADRNKGFDAAAFYEALAQVVQNRKVRWRRVAKETGISTSTLTHMKQGRGPNAASLAALCAWAGLNPADFVETSIERVEKQAAKLHTHPLTAISSFLKADPDLQPEAAKALEQIIRLAYRRFAQRRGPGGAGFGRPAPRIAMRAADGRSPLRSK